MLPDLLIHPDLIGTQVQWKLPSVNTLGQSQYDYINQMITRAESNIKLVIVKRVIWDFVNFITLTN